MSSGPVGGSLCSADPAQAMNWQSWLAGLFVVLALAGCQGTAGPVGAQNRTPSSGEDWERARARRRGWRRRGGGM